MKYIFAFSVGGIICAIIGVIIFGIVKIEQHQQVIRDSITYKVVCSRPGDEGRYARVFDEYVSFARTNKNGTYIQFEEEYNPKSLDFSPAWHCIVSKWTVNNESN